MNVKELLKIWERTARGDLTTEEFMVRLPIEDAAKLHALAEMYPRRSIPEIITDLLSAALHELESGLPYVSGNQVAALDEEGDPMYEDIGPTPRYLALTQKHLLRYRTPSEEAH